MQRQYVQFLQAFVVFPIFTANLLFPMTGLGLLPVADKVSAENSGPFQDVTDNQQIAIKDTAKKIDAYLTDRGSPIAGYGQKLAQAAYDNGLPLTLLAAISVRESGAYENACKRDPENGFGWSSCKHVDFASIDEAIQTVAKTLGKNNPKTAHYYEGKSLEEMLTTYNGDAVSGYAKQVIKIMDTIESYDVDSK